MNAPLRHQAHDVRRRAEAMIKTLLEFVNELVRDLDRLDELAEDLEPEPDIEVDPTESRG